MSTRVPWIFTGSLYTIVSQSYLSGTSFETGSRQPLTPYLVGFHVPRWQFLSAWLYTEGMDGLRRCQACGQEVSAEARFCTGCGKRLVPESQPEARSKEILNLRILYGMVAALILAVLFPPWESPPGAPPAYLGMHFLLSPPEPGAVVSRLLQTVELVTLAIAGMYLAWVFRARPGTPPEP